MLSLGQQRASPEKIIFSLRCVHVTQLVIRTLHNMTCLCCGPVEQQVRRAWCVSFVCLSDSKSTDHGASLSRACWTANSQRTTRFSFARLLDSKPTGHVFLCGVPFGQQTQSTSSLSRHVPTCHIYEREACTDNGAFPGRSRCPRASSLGLYLHVLLAQSTAKRRLKRQVFQVAGYFSLPLRLHWAILKRSSVMVTKDSSVCTL